MKTTKWVCSYCGLGRARFEIGATSPICKECGERRWMVEELWKAEATLREAGTRFYEELAKFVALRSEAGDHSKKGEESEEQFATLIRELSSNEVDPSP